MKIVIDGRIINSTTGRYIERLVYYLEKIDLENDYVILVPKKDEFFYVPTNPHFTIEVADYDQYSINEQTGLYAHLKRLQPDLVHFAMPQQPVLYRGLKVTTIHDLSLLRIYNSDKNWIIFKFKQLVGQFVFRSAAKRSKFILTDAEFTKKDIHTSLHTPLDKIAAIHLGSDVVSETMKPYPHMQNKKYLLYVGAHSDYKNVRGLVKAHQKLLESHPDLQLVLVGKKSPLHIRNEQWVAMNNYKNIHFTGFVDDDQLAWLYAHTVCYVFPSFTEGFGLPGLEAMGCGAPVASSDRTCLPEILGDAAVYFDPSNVDNIVTVVNKVLVDDGMRNNMIQQGYIQHSRFSWEETARKTHSVYMQALESRKST